MLELDLADKNVKCCVCDLVLVDKVEEHQRTCRLGVLFKPFQRKFTILVSRSYRLHKQRDIVLDKLIRNEALPVKNELGPDFCLRCTSVEQHRKESCLMMTRVQALEAIFPNLEYALLTNEDNRIKWLTGIHLNYEMNKRQREREEKLNELSQIVENLRCERISDRSIRSEMKEHREIMRAFDEQTVRMKAGWDAEQAEVRNKAITDVRCQLHLRFRSARRRLLSEERNNPSGAMMRFVSTYNSNEKQDTSLKAFLL